MKDPRGGPLVPAIQELNSLVAEVVKKIGEAHRKAYAAIAQEIVDAAEGRILEANVEEILSAIRRKVVAMGPKDELAGISRSDLETTERVVRETIATAALPTEDQVPKELPHHLLARWIGRLERREPVEIFTTNYDTLLERALEDERIPVFDGFVGSRQPFFLASSLLHEEVAPGRAWTRLWKVHGSVNWAWRTAPDQTRRIVRGQEHPGGELIFPSFYKYDESRKQPYVAMLDRLGRLLTARDDTLLITIGYSFADDHINEILFESLDVRDRLHLVALQFTDPSPQHVLIRRAVTRKNVLVYGPTRAVVGGVMGEWRLSEPVDQRTASLLDVPFDSDAAVGPETAALTGRFRLGDFNWFSRFLESLSAPSPR